MGDDFLADDKAEPRTDLRQQPEQGGRGFVNDATAGDIARGLGHRARQQAANGEIAGFRYIVAGSAAIQREHFETGQRGLGVAQILAFGTGDVGDRAQHECGGHGQFERQAGEAQRPARRAGRYREDLVGAVAIADRPAIQAGEREFERDFHRRHGRVVNEPCGFFRGQVLEEINLSPDHIGEAERRADMFEPPHGVHQGGVVGGRHLRRVELLVHPRVPVSAKKCGCFSGFQARN